MKVTSKATARFAWVGWCWLARTTLTLWANPPILRFEPQDQAVVLYQPAAFEIVAVGESPMSYQWFKGSTPIAAATNAQIVVSHAQFDDAGKYSVIVSNPEGSATSTEARLTVIPPKAGDLDYSFACPGTSQAGVRSIVALPDRKALIVGDFSVVHGTVQRGIARLNADGTTDHTFRNSISVGAFDRAVTCAAPQSDGKVLIGGYFMDRNTGRMVSIARLNVDGTFDEGFKVTIGYVNDGHGEVGSILLQPDGKVIIGGAFISVNGTRRHGGARLKKDGSLDPTFADPLMTNAINDAARPLALQTDGKVIVEHISIIAADDFGYGMWLDRLTADGQWDTTFQKAPVAVFYPRSDPKVVVQSGNRMLVAGDATKDNGALYELLAQFSPDGSRNEGFHNGLLDVLSGVDAIAVQPDGKVLVAGSIQSTDTGVSELVARFHTNGASDESFQKALVGGSYPGLDERVRSIAVQADGKVLIAGTFRTVNGFIRSDVARLNADGTLDASYANDPPSLFDAPVSVVVPFDNEILVGGNFLVFNPVTRQYQRGLARLTSDGVVDSHLLQGFTGIERSSAATSQVSMRWSRAPSLA